MLRLTTEGQIVRATMERIRKTYWKLDEGLALYVVGFVILVMAAYVTANVIGRYGFDAPVKGMKEWVGLLLVPTSFFCLSYGWRRKGTFVTVDFLLLRTRGKLRWGLELFCRIATLVFAAAIGYGGLAATLWAFETKDAYGSSGSLITTWPLRASIFVGSLLLAINPIFEIIESFQKRWGKEEKQASA
jgi:TRAP-type C4-dicarboxylate transport system permease small subunit